MASRTRETGPRSSRAARASAPGVVQLAVDYETREQCEHAFARELYGGAVFVPTLDELEVGQCVRVAFDLRFCATRFELDGAVVALLPAPIASAGAEPGIAVQFREPPAELRERIERASGIQLGDVPPRDAKFPLAEPRFPAQAPVLLEIQGRRLSAELADVSYNGMLALLPLLDLRDVSELIVHIEHPRSGEKIELESRIANQTRCHGGWMALGLEFRYELERADAVSHFVDDLRSFHHARKLAAISGSLADTPLETVLETFSSVSSSGTFRLTRGDERGKIVYQDGEILYVTIGLLSGAKALDRLFTWSDAQFEFRPEVEPMDGMRGRLPLTPAVLAAVVARDELRQLELADFDLDATFTLDEARLDAIASALDAVSAEIVENARMGFPLGALLDMLTCSDARILKSVADLIEAGVLKR